MMIKGILFDIDDTLLSHKIHMVPKATVKLLHKLKDKGYKLGICTSRVIGEMVSMPPELFDLMDCKIMGTGSTTMVDDKYYQAYVIDKELTKEYIEYFRKHNISYSYTDLNGDLFYWGDFDAYRENGFFSLAGKKVMFKDYEGEEITNIYYFFADEKDHEVIKNINPKGFVSKHGTCGNICPTFVDKEFGLLKFCEVFGFTSDEVVACGDSFNDNNMLKTAGIGIAVLNAKDETKQAADYVCAKSIEDGGLYDAFCDLKIIEEDKFEAKAFFFDNDSTIFDHNVHCIRPKTIEALQKLKDNGYYICLNTSRGLDECYNIPQAVMEMFDIVSLLGGAYLIDRGVHKPKFINQNTVDKLIKYFDEHGLTYRIATKDGGGFLNQHDEDKEALFYRLYEMTPPVKKYEGEEVCHFIYYPNSDDQKEEVKALLKDETYCDLTIAGEIAPSNTDKATSMVNMAKMLNVDLANCVAFGDGGNDITMLEQAGLGVAMGNACDRLKAVADYITDDMSDEGIYNGLKHFGFID